MKPLGLFGGKIVDLKKNAVPFEERGHVFGDATYEVTEAYRLLPILLRYGKKGYK